MGEKRKAPQGRNPNLVGEPAGGEVKSSGGAFEKTQINDCHSIGVQNMAYAMKP